MKHFVYIYITISFNESVIKEKAFVHATMAFSKAVVYNMSAIYVIYYISHKASFPFATSFGFGLHSEGV